MGSPRSVSEKERVFIFFDGVCNLCNGVVKFIIKRDQKGIFKFASLQSDFAKSQLARFNVSPEFFDSFVVVDGPLFLTRSDAALHIAKLLGGPWKAAAVLKMFPRFIRDAGYNLIGSNR